MLSLGKCTDEQGVRDFDERLRRELDRAPLTYTCEPKIDGVAVRPTYARATATSKRKRGFTRTRTRPCTTVTTSLPFGNGYYAFLAPVNVVLERLVDVAPRQLLWVLKEVQQRLAEGGGGGEVFRARWVCGGAGARACVRVRVCVELAIEVRMGAGEHAHAHAHAHLLQ